MPWTHRCAVKISGVIMRNVCIQYCVFTQLRVISNHMYYIRLRSLCGWVGEITKFSKPWFTKTFVLVKSRV